MIYKSIVLPTSGTLELFKLWFGGAPFSVNYDKLHVVLGTSRQPFETDPHADYYAVPGSMGMWYDPPTARSYWIIPLVPQEDMVARAREVGCAWDMRFVPFIVLESDSINNKRYTKAFVNSIATMLVDTSPILQFSAEMCVGTDDTVPEHHAFYQDYIARGGVSNQLLSREDEGLE
jgi:hypothetical protein